MSDAGSDALVEVPIGSMPRGHLLLHNAAAWLIRCTPTSLYIHPDSQASFVTFPPLVNGLKKSISLAGPMTMWIRRLLEPSNLFVYPANALIGRC